MVNQSFARKFFPREDVLGKRFRSPDGGSAWIPIVGLVGDVRFLGLEKAPEPEVYFFLPETRIYAGSLYFAVRTRDLAGTTASFRSAVKDLDPNQPVFDLMSMEDQLHESLATRRLNLLLLSAFALLALTLAAVGTFGVLSYSVAQRTQEIGIRMALGSDRFGVIKLVLREAILLSFAGVILGLAGALALTRFMSSLLYSTHTADPLTMAVASTLLIIVGGAAGYLPARHASKVDPLIALRAD